MPTSAAEPIAFPNEPQSNARRSTLTQHEPVALRTLTPSQAVFSRSAGVYHWTADGRRLYDFSSGVLVVNLGHNPHRWMQRFAGYMGWKAETLFGAPASAGHYVSAVPMTAYNAMTEIEAEAVERLLKNMRSVQGGNRMETVMWAASGSEAVQKALWACLHRDTKRDLIVATRYGFHGKKGLAGAVTGSETDKDRDPRVKFISFPREEVDDVDQYGQPIDLAPYRQELESLWNEYGSRLNVLITEPYLGGGGSFHPPKEYHQLLQEWCRAHDIVLIFDEIQSNFGRTGEMYAYTKYGVEPDIVCLGKGLGNGVPVSAAVGRSDIMASLQYGEGSDTWSANPIACAAVLATLDEFESTDVLEHTRKLSTFFLEELNALKPTGVVTKVRGEGLVFGLECAAGSGNTPHQTALNVVRTCYLGERGGDGIHLLGPLAGKVLRISPPMTMTMQEAIDSLGLLRRLVGRVY
jgi:4-aminobutyrate aminotransferase-like enzyme